MIQPAMPEEPLFGELLEWMRRSAFVIILQPQGDPDLKISCELGAAVLLGKPILVVQRPGIDLPAKLAAVADAVCEFSGDETRLDEAIARMLEKSGIARDA